MSLWINRHTFYYIRYNTVGKTRGYNVCMVTIIAKAVHDSVLTSSAWTVIADFGAAVAAIAAAISAWLSWRAIRQQVMFERPFLVPGFTTITDGKSILSITNVGKRTATFVTLLVSTSGGYCDAQLVDPIRPNKTRKYTFSDLLVNLNDVPLAHVSVSCMDGIENIQLAWSLDGKVAFEDRPQAESLGIKETFKMLHPVSLEGKTRVEPIAVTEV
jgi:hypothetical protein